jgi:hypothetical protein
METHWLQICLMRIYKGVVTDKTVDQSYCSPRRLSRCGTVGCIPRCEPRTLQGEDYPAIQTTENTYVTPTALIPSLLVAVTF